jgi:hypothetical protein
MMNRVGCFVALFAVASGSRCGRNEHDQRALVSKFAGNATLHPALRTPGMDMRAGDFLVMDIP